jgi:hypothetical protein
MGIQREYLLGISLTLCLLMLCCYLEKPFDEINRVMSILNKFCHNSGQKVSFEKTSIMFSKNMSRETKEVQQHASGFGVTFTRLKYMTQNTCTN